MEKNSYPDTFSSRPSESSDGGKKLDAESFKELRKSRRLTQRWVADKCGCSHSLISKWEKGAHSPSGEVMHQIMLTKAQIETIPVSDLKHCWKCGTRKPLSLFGRDSSRPNGHQSKCIACNHQIVQAWRNLNKTRSNDRRRVRYKISRSGSRQAGYKWVNGDKRSRQEIRQLGAKNELSLRKTPFRCSPIKKAEGHTHAKLIQAANQILKSAVEEDCHMVTPKESFIDIYGRQIRRLHESGRINTEQSKRLARHIAARSPYALEQYWSKGFS